MATGHPHFYPRGVEKSPSLLGIPGLYTCCSQMIVWFKNAENQKGTYKDCKALSPRMASLGTVFNWLFWRVLEENFWLVNKQLWPFFLRRIQSHLFQKKKLYCQWQEREEIKVESTQGKRIAKKKKKRQKTLVLKPEMKPKSPSDTHVPGNLHFQGLLSSQEWRHLINLHHPSWGSLGGITG